jgi:hypothetical protein
MSFKKWDEMSLLEQYRCIYSDRFKDAYGVRPTNDISDWNEMRFLDEFAYLNAIVAKQIEEEI